MPRKPTTEVIEHRITLGGYERRIISDAVAGYNFKNVATPVVAGLSDISFVIFVGGIIGLFLDSVLPNGWRSITQYLSSSERSDWYEAQNIVGAGIGGAVGLFFGNPIAGAVLGSLAVEGLEELAGAGEEILLENPAALSLFTSVMLNSYWAIDGLKETLT